MMQKNQFISLEGYAAVPSRISKKQRGVRDIIGEADRIESNSRHIDAPRPPEVLFGNLKGLADSLIAESDDLRSELGKRQRRDTQILLTTVISYPVPFSELDDKGKQRLRCWLVEVVAWVKSQFGKHLNAVVMHTDENYPHVHCFVSDHGRSISPLHPGRAAGVAYKKKMHELQVSFWKQVSAQFNFSHRSKEPRKRLSRKKHLAGERETKTGVRYNVNDRRDRLKPLQSPKSRYDAAVSGVRSPDQETTRVGAETTDEAAVGLVASKDSARDDQLKTPPQPEAPTPIETGASKPPKPNANRPRLSRS